MIKKILSIVLCTALAASVTACAGSAPAAAPQATAAPVPSAQSPAQPSPSADAKPAAPAEKVKIVFWDENAGPTFTPVYMEFIKKFEEQNPDITVEYVGIPWESSKQKYDVAIASGTTPDVAGVPASWLGDFFQREALLPLDDFFNNWSEKDKYPKSLMDSNRSAVSDGKLYGLVSNTNMACVWYRKDLFEQKGITPPENWEQFFKAVEAGTDKANNIYGFSIRGGAGGANQLQEAMYAYSGIENLFDENGKSTVADPKNVEFLTKFTDMYKTYTPESDITNGYKEMVAAFDSGFANMIIHNMGSYAEHVAALPEGSFGFLPIPRAENGKRVIFSGSQNGYSIFSSTKYPEQSWRFISFLCAPEQISVWSKTFGKIPPHSDVLKEAWVQETEHIKLAAAALADPQLLMPRIPVEIPGYADVMNNTVGPALQEMLAKKITPQQFAEKWAAAMTAAKAEYEAMK